MDFPPTGESPYKLWIREERNRWASHAREQGLEPTPAYWREWLEVAAFYHMERAVTYLTQVMSGDDETTTSHNAACDDLIRQIVDYRLPVVRNETPVDAHYTDFLDALELRVAELQTMSDTEYKLTEEWRETREAAVRRADGRCQGCNSTENVQIHRRTPERRGEEAPGDLIAVCPDCHIALHQMTPT